MNDQMTAAGLSVPDWASPNESGCSLLKMESVRQANPNDTGRIHSEPEWIGMKVAARSRKWV